MFCVSLSRFFFKYLSCKQGKWIVSVISGRKEKRDTLALPCNGTPCLITANPGTDGPCRLNPITFTPFMCPVYSQIRHRSWERIEQTTDSLNIFRYTFYVNNKQYSKKLHE